MQAFLIEHTVLPFNISTLPGYFFYFFQHILLLISIIVIYEL